MHQRPDGTAGRNAHPHQRYPQDVGMEDSKSLKTGGESGEQMICGLAEEGDDVSFFFF